MLESFVNWFKAFLKNGTQVLVYKTLPSTLSGFGWVS